METSTLTTKQYHVSGMTCGGCVASVKEVLEKVEGVQEASVNLVAPQATLTIDQELDLTAINQLLRQKGKYTISEEMPENSLMAMPSINQPEAKPAAAAEKLPAISLSTYKPLILIVAFIAGVSALAQYPFADFSGMLWMRHFMAGFFLVFAFFKLLNLNGFASSYRMYDIVAAKWKTWGYIYPFVELALGVAYLINWAPYFTNITTVVVLGVSSIGVIESNLNKRKIKCACLGDVFNLPMSTVTIVEDLAMVGMAAWMLFVL